MTRTESREVIVGATLSKDQSQDMEIKITDVVGLSKPLTRLIEVMAQGFGAVSRQYLTIRNADAEANKIRKIAEAIKDVAQQHQLPVVHDDGTTEIWQKPEDRTLILGETTLEARAHKRADFQERKRQANLESVTSAAAVELAYEEDVPDERPDEDWVTRFFDSAQDVSSAQMQQIWGRLLAGEIKTPGSFSLRTLEFIRNLSQHEAGVIDRAFRFSLSTNNAKDGNFLYRDTELLEKTSKLSSTYLLLLEEVGVISLAHANINFELKTAGAHCLLLQGDLALIINTKKDNEIFSIPIYDITSIGREIIPLLPISARIEYIREIGQKLCKGGRSGTIIKVRARHSDGRVSGTPLEEIADTPP